MQTLTKTLAIGILLSLSGLALATNCHCCDDTGCSECAECPNCKLKVEKAKVKKYCWEVECKPICVPKVRLPWQSCCEPLCAEGRNIHVLKKVEYECEECKYTWTPEENGGCANGACCGNGCSNCCESGCTAAGCEGISPPLELQPAPAPTAPVSNSAKLPRAAFPKTKSPAEPSKVLPAKLGIQDAPTNRLVRLLDGMKLGSKR
jgi:hypothetical protein